MSIYSQLKLIQQKIASFEQKYQRQPNSVQLLAVSKGQSIEKIIAAINAGQHAFGENYLQESMLKITALSSASIEWHFIGHIQRNKAKIIAQNFAWVHTIDRITVAKQLNQHRSQHLAPLNVCIQVNVDHEVSKAGISLDELPSLAHAIASFPHLKLRGLMTIPKPTPLFDEQRKAFHTLQTALQSLNNEGFALDTLSMGMSEDYEAAIAEGTTLIRLGTAIFGERRT